MLEALRDNFTIVVVGNWNVSIFSPEWVGRNIFENKAITLEFEIGSGLQRRLSVDDVIIIPSSSSLMVTSNKVDDITLKRMENVACKILELLNHTPVRAVGVNFGYRLEPLAGSSCSEIPVIMAEKLASEDLVIGLYEIKWSVGYGRERKTLLNLSVKIGKDDALIKFNFHSDIENTGKGIESIRDQVIVYKNKALSVLDKLFGVSPEV